MRIGIDLDGVNISFVDGCNVIRKKNGESPYVEGTWAFYEKNGMTGADFKAWCDKAADEGLLFGNDPYPGAVEAVRRIRDLGHTIVIITDRTFGSTPKVSQDLTVKWLNKHGYEFDELHFDADKTAYRVDMMVEDKLENYDALVAAGVDAYLIDRVWNQVPGGDGRKRITDITEFADMVEVVTELGYADLALV